MITNFEDITENLTEEDLKIVKILVAGLSKRTKDNPLKGPEIVKIVNNNKDKYGIKTSFSNVRLRKCCNYIRTNGLLPIIATSRGYYVSEDKGEILKQIESLEQRANSILKSAEGLKKIINKNFKVNE
jgi:hypothetical protein